MPMLTNPFDVDIPGAAVSGYLVATNTGEFFVFNGASIVDTFVADEGSTAILDSGTASATTLGDAGLQTVDGQGGVATAIDTVIAFAGLEGVISGGVTSGAMVLPGGIENIGAQGSAVRMSVGGFANIFSGGITLNSTVVSGGLLTVFAGGTDKFARIDDAGTVNVSSGGMDSSSLVDLGTLNVSAGGVVSGASGEGTLNVDSGGTAEGIGTLIPSGALAAGGAASAALPENFDGTMNVSSGGTVSGVSIGKDGTLTVSAGGVVSALAINDPNDPNVTAVANIMSGGAVDGSIKINGGELLLDAGAVMELQARLTIVNTGELLLGQDSFKGIIHDFGGQDFMDLSKVRFIGQGTDATTATFTQTNAASGQLQVAQGSHVADLHLAGSYATANFALQSDGVHGTVVVFVP